VIRLVLIKKLFKSLNIKDRKCKVLHWVIGIELERGMLILSQLSTIIELDVATSCGIAFKNYFECKSSSILL